MTESVPIERPQPSQLYVDGERLREAVEWFDFDRPSYDPIPVLRLEGELVLADGHTRALLAYLGGASSLEIRTDLDRDVLNIPLYRECVSWCRDESITTVADLAGRVVGGETFQEEWLGRCRASPHYSED